MKALGNGLLPSYGYYKELVLKLRNIYQFVTSTESVIDLLPFGREQKMLGFSQVLKPIKWQDLLEEGKNGRNGVSNRCKDSF